MEKIQAFFLNVKNIVSEHKLAIIFAMVAALIVASPQCYQRIDQKNSGVYQGIELLPDSPWSPRVREVMDGYLNFGSVYWKEGKNEPYLFQSFGSAVVAYAGNIFSLDINNTLLFARFFYTFVISMLIYSFVLILSREKVAALVSAVLIILGNDVLDPRGLLLFFHGESPVNFLTFGLPVIPMMSHLFLFGFLVSFYIFIRKNKWIFGALSAILLGIQFYNYFYLWTYLYAFGGLFGLMLLCTRAWRKAGGVALVYSGAILIAIPYLSNLHEVVTHPMYEVLSTRIGMVYTHTPLFVGAIVMLSIIIFCFGFPREDRIRYMFSTALLITPFITLNQQIITGKIMQVGHYHYYIHKPIAVIFIIVSVFTFLKYRGLMLYKNALAVFIIAFSIIVGVFIQYASYTSDNVYGGAIAVERQKYGPVMSWLNEHAKKDEVVFANDEISHLVTIYTPLNVFFHRGVPATTLMATEERLLDVFFTYFKLRGISATDAKEVFFQEREYLSVNLYHLHYREVAGSVDAIPDTKIEEIITQYTSTFSVSTQQYLNSIWEKYDVEYFIWDTEKNPEWKLEQFPFGHKVADFGSILLYEREDATNK